MIAVHLHWIFVNQGGRSLNIKMPCYQYRDSRVKDKTVSRPSYLNMGILILERDGLYIETGPMWAKLSIYREGKMECEGEGVDGMMY